MSSREKSPVVELGVSGTTPISSSVDDTPKAIREGQKRDLHGRFREVAHKPDVRSASQKQRDRVFSHVSRWEKAIDITIEKIQKARPEVSQLYVMETNIARGNRKPFVIRTEGGVGHVPDEILDEAREVPENDRNSGLNGGDEQIGRVSLDNTVTIKAGPRRPAGLYCFICKEKLGTDSKKRIGKY